MSTENAISAMGKIFKVYGGQLDLVQLIPAWVNFLPVHEDKEEAVIIYNNLCYFIEQNSTLVFGNSYEHLPKVVTVLVSALNTKLENEEVEKRVTTILKGMQHLPPQVLQSTWASITPETQSALQKVLSS